MHRGFQKQPTILNTLCNEDQVHKEFAFLGMKTASVPLQTPVNVDLFFLADTPTSKPQ